MLVLVQATPTSSTGPSSVYAPALNLEQGTAFTGVVARFNHAASPALLTDSIAWGDGSYSTPTVVSYADGHYDLVDSHTYNAAGIETITIQISWADGSSLAIHGGALVSTTGVTSSAGGYGGGGTSPATSGSLFGFVVLSFEFSAPAQGPNGQPQASPPPLPVGSHGGRGMGPPAGEPGSPADSFRAVLFSPAANSPVEPGNPVAVSARVLVDILAPIPGGLARVNGLQVMLPESGSGTDQGERVSQVKDGLESTEILYAQTLRFPQTGSEAPPGPNSGKAAPSTFVPAHQVAAVETGPVFDPGASQDWTAFADRLLNGDPDEATEAVAASLVGSALLKPAIADSPATPPAGLERDKESPLAFDWRGLWGEVFMLALFMCLYVQQK
jgi:hypothetical protein